MLEAQIVTWGPNWAWVGLPSSQVRAVDGVAGLGCVVRIPVGIQPRRVVGFGGQFSVGSVECGCPDTDRTVPHPGADGDARGRAQGQVISSRKVSLQELREGNFGFSDKVEQQGDIKEFEGTVPPETLAAGRVVVEFTETPQPSTLPDMKQFEQDKVITSQTGQLRWDFSQQGFFTVDTPGTKAVVGFAEGKEQRLGDVTMELQCPCASLFLTAAGQNETLATAKSALISAVARNCNSGFKVLTFDNHVLDNGKGPVMLEPVKATITIGTRQIAVVNVLDHDGKRTGKTLQVTGDTFTIDGANDKAIYYEVVFE